MPTSIASPRTPVGHHANPIARFEKTVDEAAVGDDALVRVVVRVEDQRAQRRRAVALRRRDALDDGLEDLVDADALLGRGQDAVVAGQPDDTLDLLARHLRLGAGQVDLVDDRDDLEVVLEGEVDIGQRLRLDALGGVDHQQGAFARGQRARHLVGEVDVAGRIDQVELVHLAVGRAVLHADGLGLDGDALLALEVHGVEHLLRHVALSERAGALEQSIGERRLAMIDMRDDDEIAYVRLVQVARSRA